MAVKMQEVSLTASSVPTRQVSIEYSKDTASITAET